MTTVSADIDSDALDPMIPDSCPFPFPDIQPRSYCLPRTIVVVRPFFSGNFKSQVGEEGQNKVTKLKERIVEKGAGKSTRFRLWIKDTKCDRRESSHLGRNGKRWLGDQGKNWGGEVENNKNNCNNLIINMPSIIIITANIYQGFIMY